MANPLTTQTTPTAQNVPVAITPAGLAARTKAKLFTINGPQPFVDGGNITFNIQRNGLGLMLWIQVRGSITVAASTITAGTWQGVPNQVPYALFKKVRFGSNSAQYMHDHAGWGGKKWLRNRYGIDSQGPSPVLYSNNAQQLLGQSAVNNLIVAGANVTAGTYDVNFSYPIPLAYNFLGETALVVLQNQTLWQLSLDLAQISGGISTTGPSTNDFFKNLTGTNIVVTSNIVVEATLEAYDALSPAEFDYSAQYALYKSVTEQTFPLVAGQNILQPGPTDYITTTIIEAYNNGAGLSDANLGVLSGVHSGNEQLFSASAYALRDRSFWMHGIPQTNGVIDWDMGLRAGMIDRRDTLDAFNDQAITDFRYILNTPNNLVVTAPSGITMTTESLRLTQIQ